MNLRPAALGAALVFAALVAVAPATVASADRHGTIERTDAVQRGRDAARAGAAYVVDRQRPNGAFFDAAQPADGLAETLASLVAAGVASAPVRRALDRLATTAPARAAERPSYAGRIVLGLVAAGEDPSSFRGHDYVADADAGYNAATGSYDTNLYANLLAALAVASARGALPERAIEYVRTNQCPGGGFSWREGCLGPPDADTTSVAIATLRAAGLPAADDAVRRAVDALRSFQTDDGGFGLEAGHPTNANSTGLVLSALAAAGEDVHAERWRGSGGSSPLEALLALQLPSGGFRYTAAEDRAGDYATVQALPGAAGVAMPVRPAPSRSDGTSVPTGTPDDARGVGVATRPPRGRARPDDAASAGGRAGLVVTDADGVERRMCVTFDEPSISGLELLERAGLAVDVETSALGSAVCRLDGRGCSSGDCFCRYPAFWGYWTKDAEDASFAFAQEGASAREVTDGDVDAWVWGPDGGPAPEPLDVEAVCAQQASRTATPDVASAPTAADRRGGGTDTSALAAGAVALLASGAALAWHRRRTA